MRVYRVNTKQLIQKLICVILLDDFLSAHFFPLKETEFRYSHRRDNLCIAILKLLHLNLL